MGCNATLCNFREECKKFNSPSVYIVTDVNVLKDAAAAGKKIKVGFGGIISFYMPIAKDATKK